MCCVKLSPVGRCRRIFRNIIKNRSAYYVAGSAVSFLTRFYTCMHVSQFAAKIPLSEDAAALLKVRITAHSPNIFDDLWFFLSFCLGTTYFSSFSLFFFHSLSNTHTFPSYQRTATYKLTRHEDENFSSSLD